MPPAEIEADAHAAAEPAPGQVPPQPPYRSGLPAIARPQPRRARWPYWVAGAVLLAVALGAVLVLHADGGAKSAMPWRATGLSLVPLTDGPLATADAREDGGDAGRQRTGHRVAGQP